MHKINTDMDPVPWAAETSEGHSVTPRVVMASSALLQIFLAGREETVLLFREVTTKIDYFLSYL